MSEPLEIDELETIAKHRGWLQADDQIISIGSAGAGNMNRVLRAHLVSGRCLIFKQSLPYVAKFPDIAAPVNRIGTEAAFYDAISGTQLTEHTPSIIGYAPESFLLCMEDLGDGADLTTIYNKGLPAELPELLTWLRTLHDLPINNPLDFANTAMRELNHAHIFSIPFSTGNGLTFNAELQDCRHALLSDELSVRVVAMGKAYLKVRADQGSLLHGDFYPGSWLAHETRGFAVIDPEFGFYGPPEFDVGVMIAHLYFGGASPSQVQTLLQAYNPSNTFSRDLSTAYAGIEILRRIFGVAQLPLNHSDAQKVALAQDAVEMVMQ